MNHRSAEQFDQSYLDFLFDSSHDAVVMADNEGRISRANAEFVRLFGWCAEELRGRFIDALIVPEVDLEAAVAITRRTAAGERMTLDVTRRRKDGTLVQVMVSSMPFRVRGRQVGTFGIYRDQTERRQAQQDKQISDRRLRLITENALDIITVLTGDGLIQYISPSVERVLGYTPEERQGRTAFELVHLDDVVTVEMSFLRMLETPGPAPAMEFRHAHKDGGWRVLEAVPNNLLEEATVRGVVITLRNVTERREAERALRESQEQLVHEAFHDALTGLPNRNLFMDRLDECIARTHRRRDDLSAVLFLDLDRFKLINDSLGHIVGDQLLTAIARRLEGCLRPGDLVARLGGDEFTVLLDHIQGESDAIHVAERIAAALAAPFTLGHHEVFTSASVGIALTNAGYQKAEDLLRDADTAMYRAKARGRARHEIFDHSMHTHAVSLLQLDTDLRRAAARGEFTLVYQPILATRDDRLVGFEALVRWQHPDRGTVMPDDFIPLAEETGLIVPIGRWVMDEACRQMREWQVASGRTHLAIGVNLSAKQFEQPDIVNQVADALLHSGLAPQSLKLEITESVLMAHAEASKERLDKLRALGVQVQVDDFGTGYSSLSYLHRFRVDTLKIDRSFVAGLAEQEQREIVRSIITLGHNLGVAIVAEGVETPAQRARLRALDCDYVQGFLLSQPLGALSAAALIGAESPGTALV